MSTATLTYEFLWPNLQCRMLNYSDKSRRLDTNQYFREMKENHPVFFGKIMFSVPPNSLTFIHAYELNSFPVTIL